MSIGKKYHCDRCGKFAARGMTNKKGEKKEYLCMRCARKEVNKLKPTK